MNHKTLIALTLFALLLAAFPALAQYPDAAVVTIDRTAEYGARAWDVMLDNGVIREKLS